MASLIKGRGEPFFDDGNARTFAQHVAGKTQDIGIIVFSTQFGDDFVMAGRGAHAGKLVRDDAHSDSVSANQDSVVHFARADLTGNARGNIGVIDTIRAEFMNRAQKILIVFADVLDNQIHDIPSPMVASDDNALLHNAALDHLESLVKPLHDSSFNPDIHRWAPQKITLRRALALVRGIENFHTIVGL